MFVLLTHCEIKVLSESPLSPFPKLFLSLSQTFCQRTLREVKMLTRFEHENIIDLKDVICENTVDKLKVRLDVDTCIRLREKSSNRLRDSLDMY